MIVEFVLLFYKTRQDKTSDKETHSITKLDKPPLFWTKLIIVIHSDILYNIWRSFNKVHWFNFKNFFNQKIY